MESEVVIKKELCNRCMQNGKGCLKYIERLERGLKSYKCKNYVRRERDRENYNSNSTICKKKWSKDNN